MRKSGKNISIKATQEIPHAFLDKMADLLGEDFEKFAFSLYQNSITGLRVNCLKIDPQEFVQLSPYPLLPTSWCKSGFIVDEFNDEINTYPPGKHPYHSTGLYYIQEPSAMVAAEVLAPKPGEKVLDLTAAPGGKSTQLASLMKNTGLLVSNEIHPKRVWDLAENIERCGVTNSIILNESPQKLAGSFGAYFDRVMVDAPCSGEGMFRKNENARREWKIELPKSCSIRQLSILEQAAAMVAPGGSLAYTTCTFSPEENEGVIAKFLEKNPEFDIESINSSSVLSPARPDWIDLPVDHKINQAIRIWPHIAQGEGHFIALLVKNSASNIVSVAFNISRESPSKFSGKQKEESKAITILKKFAQDNLSFSFDEKRIIQAGSYVYQVPEYAPTIVGFKVIHPGWWLGSIQSDRFIPSHALAMGINANQAQHLFPLHSDDLRIFSYLRGESLMSTGSDGWLVITVDGFPLGWGKRVNHVIKNHYPHGLRQTFS